MPPRTPNQVWNPSTRRIPDTGPATRPMATTTAANTRAATARVRGSEELGDTSSNQENPSSEIVAGSTPKRATRSGRSATPSLTMRVSHPHGLIHRHQSPSSGERNGITSQNPMRTITGATFSEEAVPSASPATTVTTKITAPKTRSRRPKPFGDAVSVSGSCSRPWSRGSVHSADTIRNDTITTSPAPMAK